VAKRGLKIMALDPWHYAAKTRSERAEQTALFMWANMARLFGPNIANDPHSYTVAGFAKTQFEGKGGLGYIRYSEPLHELKWLHAVHNQGHGDAIRGAQAKAEGVKAGVADIFLPVPRYTGLIASRLIGQPPYAVTETAEAFCGLYIELKKKDSGKPHAEQLEFQADMRLAGYKCEIIHGWELARDEILRYLGKL
jgi:hypothetical protein